MSNLKPNPNLVEPEPEGKPNVEPKIEPEPKSKPKAEPQREGKPKGKKFWGSIFLLKKNSNKKKHTQYQLIKCSLFIYAVYELNAFYLFMLSIN